MMKHEFDSLVGITTAPEAYARIEYIYTNSDKFATKQDIADFYKKRDMNGIEGIYYELASEEIKKNEFKQYVSDLATFAEGYVVEIKKYLSKIAVPTFKDKTVVKLLREHSIRLEKERQELLKDFIMNTLTPHEGVSFSNNALTNSSHYKTVLHGILIDEWQQSKKQKTIPTC